MTDRRYRKLLIVIPVFVVMLLPGLLSAQSPLPGVSLSFGQVKSAEDIAVTIQILVLLTVLTLAPSILMMMTSFTRIVVVLHFVRQAMGTQGTPPNQVIIGLSLFLTMFIM
ncbi:MAG: flagellar biosynthetic protein FliP, partial [Calditrichaeota bacterium]|nr:flagellar biosynthetic protein FliP [Calditrichota bacterium]